MDDFLQGLDLNYVIGKDKEVGGGAKTGMFNIPGMYDVKVTRLTYNDGNGIDKEGKSFAGNKTIYIQLEKENDPTNTVGVTIYLTKAVPKGSNNRVPNSMGIDVLKAIKACTGIPEEIFKPTIAMVTDYNGNSVQKTIFPSVEGKPLTIRLIKSTYDTKKMEIVGVFRTSDKKTGLEIAKKVDSIMYAKSLEEAIKDQEEHNTKYAKKESKDTPDSSSNGIGTVYNIDTEDIPD